MRNRKRVLEPLRSVGFSTDYRRLYRVRLSVEWRADTLYTVHSTQISVASME